MALSWLGFLALVAVFLVAVRPALPGPAYAAALTVAGLAFCAVLGRLDRTLPAAGFQLLWGLVFGGLRLATGRLVLPVFAHALVDILGG